MSGSGNPIVKKFGYSDLDEQGQNKLFDQFSSSYKKETGSSWDRPKFESRAQNWEFHGDADGFIAVRPQKSGMKKMVGVAGDPRSILKGVDSLQAEGGPIWGAVSSPLASMAKKRGMIVPHLHFGGPTLIKKVVPSIPDSVFGGVKPEVQKDGGLVMDYPDVGKTTKYLVMNKEYLKEVLKHPDVSKSAVGNAAIKTFLKLVGI
ncbi:hypothetical protein UFOVP1414_3 [uncultured Caudovirales phage]|uniref:Uncharacterized protein n=2 Tax=uncultured Caudovirales phage TaxID=2100421 RepID=A0A6J5SCU2_9CAUD|nr:hypothetical protein UFOVP1414_3 [uncultured Caudovirales phage]